MGLLSKLRSALGLGTDEDDVGRRSTDVGVTVERERDDADAENEATVKGVDATESAEPDDEPTPAESTTTESATAESTTTESATAESATTESADSDAVVDDAADDDATAVADEESTDATDEPGAESTDATDEPSEESGADAGEDVQNIKGIGPAYADRLADVGIETVGHLAAADHETVAEEADLAPGRVEQWVDRANARQ